MSAFERAIKIAGGQSALSRKIGRSQSVISYWVTRRGGLVPAEVCADIEAAVDGAVTRQDLRPDVFGVPA